MILKSTDLFDQLDPEREPVIRKNEVIVPSGSLTEIVENFHELIQKFSSDWKNCTEYDILEDYNSIFDFVPICSSKTIESFHAAAQSLFDFKENIIFSTYGIYVSCMMNKSPDLEFKLYTHPHGNTYLGFKNKKKITLFGDFYGTGDSMDSGELHLFGTSGGMLGWQMNGGKIFLSGRHVHNIGYINGGEIVVHGSVDGIDGLRKGTIQVYGHVEDIGKNFEIEGGEIFIYGTYGQLADKNTGGNIYHNGNLIIKNGKKLT